MIGIANDTSLKIIVSKSFSTSKMLISIPKSENRLIKYLEVLCYIFSTIIKNSIKELC